MTFQALNESEAAAFEAELRACVGLPWRHMGRQGCGYGHQTGLDCVGLAIRGLLKIGRSVRDLESYSRAPDGSLESRITAQLGAPVPGIGPRRIALFKLGKPRHVGYISDAGTLIHSRRGEGGGVVEHALDGFWRGAVVRSWAL